MDGAREPDLGAVARGVLSAGGLDYPRMLLASGGVEFPPLDDCRAAIPAVRDRRAGLAEILQ